MTVPLPGYIIGDNVECQGYTAPGPGAVEDICRQMLAAGFPANQSLVFRAGESGPVVMTVRSIGDEIEKPPG